MLHLTDRVGILVENEPYHLACAEQFDEGLESNDIYASTTQVQHWCCCGCGELLIDWEDNEELFGHEDGCTCETCILVSKMALTTSNLDSIEGYRRGLHQYHWHHALSIEQYAEQAGYQESNSFLDGYQAGYTKSQEVH
jgi:hypothetical protein